MYSQNRAAKAPLKEVLLQLEKTFNIKFSYSDALLESKNIIYTSTNKSLEKVLEDLEKKTGLVFQKTTSRYVIVLEKGIHIKGTICGYVFNEFTNVPIVEANIYVSNRNIGSYTDSKGYFELSGVHKNDTLKISFIGYKTLKSIILNNSKTTCETYLIKERTATLNEVLITNYLTKGILKNTDGSETIYPQNRGILPGLTEPDVLQSIQLLPGVQSPNETASGLNIRGGSPDQNLVLFDGIRVYNPAHFFGMISAFNPYITQKVNVYRSGVSVEYGNHISGVIDIQTNDKLEEKFTGGFGTNLTHSDAFLKIPLGKKVNLSLSGRRSITDVLNTVTFQQLSKKVYQNTIITQNKTSIDDTTFDKESFYFSDFNTKLIFQPNEKNKFVISQLYVNNNLNYQYGTNDNMFLQTDNFSVKNFGFNTKWNYSWNDNLQLNALFYLSDFKLDYNFIGIQGKNKSITETSLKNNRIKEFGFKTSLSKRINQKSSVKFGLEITNNKVNYSFGRTYAFDSESNYNITNDNKNTTYAFYAKYILKNNDKFNLNIGLRTNYFSLTKDYFLSPRIYTQYKILPFIWLKSSYELKQQNISQIKEFTTSDFGLENQVWSLSDNKEVPVLKSNQLTGGVFFKRNNWLVDVDVYYKKVTGITLLSKDLGIDAGLTENGSSISKGIDILIKKQWGNYNSWISYSFGDTQFTFPSINSNQSFAADNDISHSFVWSHSLKFNRFNFSLGWNYRTGVPYSNPVEDIDINGSRLFYYDRLNEVRLRDYHRLDFSTTYSFNFSESKKWKGKVGVSLLNIYGRKNNLKREFSVVSDENSNQELQTIDTNSLGFTPNIVFRVSF
ncbi:TonB-dependent receptor domain-containing protein [Tenacibaculum holothuriorum]|uniref:TonB-dependent receptor domain-containing protein n=1 Tax=Tenacibaculum holothuriorum TaxID=1635173 RepID=UPI001E3DB954|nr:TonB-dependent receptor [Tenacibaculum holothuriorum]